jgi:hypothetical protein
VRDGTAGRLVAGGERSGKPKTFEHSLSMLSSTSTQETDRFVSPDRLEY